MAFIIGTDGADTIAPGGVSAGVTGGVPSNAADTIEPGLGANLVDAGGGNDRIITIGIDTVEGGAGTDVWEADYGAAAGLTLTQTGPNAFAFSNGSVASGIEGFNLRLGTDATVNLVSGGLTGNASFVTVASGRVLLDWAAKTADSFIVADNSFAYGNIANTSLDEVVYLGGFTRAEIRAGSGDDLISGLGAAGRSTILGGAGDDTISTFGRDSVDGGEGTDTWNGRYFTEAGLTLRQTSATSFTLSNGTTAQGVEVYNVSLGANASVFLRSGGADGRFSSVDVLSGTLNLDWSDKTAGSYVQAQNNTSFGDRNGNGLADELVSTYGFSNAIIRTGSGNDVVFGTTGNDVIRTGAGADDLVGIEGVDTLYGGTGDDSYYLGEAIDRLVERAGEGVDRVVSSVSWRLGANFETLELFGDVGLEGFGNGLANLLRGAAGNDTLSGLLGDDSLEGGGGADRLLGAAGADSLAGGEGADTLDGGEGDDILLGGAGSDRLIGGTGADAFRYADAAEGRDVILGFVAGSDRIEVSAAGFGGGLVEGEAVSFVAAINNRATSAAGTGQFVWETDAARLWWDADGAGGAASVLVATLTGAVGVTAADIVVIA